MQFRAGRLFGVYAGVISDPFSIEIPEISFSVTFSLLSYCNLYLLSLSKYLLSY